MYITFTQLVIIMIIVALASGILGATIQQIFINKKELDRQFQDDDEDDEDMKFV